MRIDVLRRALLVTLAASGIAAALPARAELTEGTDYSRIEPPQPSPTDGQPTDKVSVIEFFSYGCSHCYEMHPKIMRWASMLPENAVFIRVPVALGRREWGVLVRTYYALESLGELRRLDTPIFEAIHREGVRLFDETSITNWLAQQGVAAGKFSAAFNSEAVSKQSLLAEEMSYAYRVNGTPAVAVGGKYMAQASTHDALLRVARELIDQVAQETKKAD